MLTLLLSLLRLRLCLRLRLLAPSCVGVNSDDASSPTLASRRCVLPSLGEGSCIQFGFRLETRRNTAKQIARFQLFEKIQTEIQINIFSKRISDWATVIEHN